MLFLEAQHIKKSIGDRDLLNIELLRVNQGDRMGLVGRNGVGKSTLMSLLIGNHAPDEGYVERHVSVRLVSQLRQAENRSGGEATAIAVREAVAANPGILLLDEPSSHLDASHQRWLQQELDSFGGAFILASHDRHLLSSCCHIIWELENGKLTVFKGNYDDYRAEKELRKRQQAEKYESYISKKLQLEEAIRIKRRKADTMLKAPKRMGNSEARLGGKLGPASAQKGIHQVIKAMETRVEKLEEVERPREERVVKMDIPESLQLSGKWAVQAEGLRLYAGDSDKQLLAPASFRVPAGAKVVLIGDNGSGKTTLLQRLIEVENQTRALEKEPLSTASSEANEVRKTPQIQLSAKARIGYFSQHIDVLDGEQSLLHNVLSTSVQSEQTVRLILARLLFSPRDLNKPVSVLSGGERAKAALAKIFVSSMNILLLDEPTSFLDIGAIEALEQLLIDYEGTIIVATHDRRFAERVGTHVLEIAGGKLHYFTGELIAYEAYKANKTATRAEAEEELLQLELRMHELLAYLNDFSLQGEGGAQRRGRVGKNKKLIQADPKAMYEQLDEEYKQLLAQRQELLGRMKRSGSTR